MTGAVEILGHFTSVQKIYFQLLGILPCLRFNLLAAQPVPCHPGQRLSSIKESGGTQESPNDMWREIWPRNATLGPGRASLVPHIRMQAGLDRGQGLVMDLALSSCGPYIVAFCKGPNHDPWRWHQAAFWADCRWSSSGRSDTSFIIEFALLVQVICRLMAPGVDKGRLMRNL